MIAPPPDLSTLPPAYQAGYAAGRRDARQHRRRNHVLNDPGGLAAYATDAALGACPGKTPRTRADFIARYVEGYEHAYRLATGQQLT